MIENIRACLFLRKNRFQKKLRLNMMGLKVLFDVTTSLYSLILVAYLVAAIFITSDFISASHSFFIMIEDRARNYFWFILAALPIRYIMQSFQWPGVVFSTSEHKMSMLPYAREKVWLFACFLKLVQKLMLYTLLGSLIFFVTPISFSLIIAYGAILLWYDIMFIIPVWKLFQERVRIKVATLGGVLLISMITFLLESPFIGLIIPLALIGLHVVLIPLLFKDINWGRVTEVSDYKIWNMPLISRATKSTYKRSKRYSVFRQSKRRKKPFKYT